MQWYHSVPGGDELSEARLRAANAQALAGRLPQALDEVHAIQSDAVVDDDVRRDAYLLEAELRQRGDDSAGELDALARGLAAYPMTTACCTHVRSPGSAATTSRAPRPTCARSW